MKEQKLKLPMTIYLAVAHLAAIYGLIILVLGKISLSTIMISLLLLYMSQLGMTVGEKKKTGPFFTEQNKHKRST